MKRWEAWGAPAIGALLTLFGASLWLGIALIGGCSDRNLVSAPERQKILATGEEMFTQVFTDSTGLGPLFNGTSCAECHNRSDDAPILGGAGDEIERHMQPLNCLDPAIVLHELPTPELATAPIGLRHANDLFGLGHLDQLTDDEIKAYVAAEPRLLGYLDGLYWYNTPELNIRRDGRVGRFGRRAQAVTLREFIAGAFEKEMGIDSTEVSAADIDATRDFVANLGSVSKPLFPRFEIKRGGHGHHGRPPQPPPDSTGSVALGALMFKTIGCAVCHNPATEYTDLAMHDLGGRDICEGNGNTAFMTGDGRNPDFRTEPLTGLGMQTQFMHDGSVTTLFDAIEQHRGEGGFSRRRFEMLSSADQGSIIAFLRSL